jgi:uncharacterized membrane protein
MDTPNAPVSPQPAATPPPAPHQDNHVLMGVLAYLGILVIIPYLMSKDVPSVKFHIKQGVVLAVIEIVIWLVSGMFWGLFMIFQIVQLALIVLSIIGIVNVVQNKEKELPLVGSLAKHVPL